MHLQSWPGRSVSVCILRLLVAALCLATTVRCMTGDDIRDLRIKTIELFYHGFDAYMTHAFPEDELRPLSCSPLTRDIHNPGHIEVNDVLGNYSLTLIDSLSTLAILASADSDDLRGRAPLWDFQNGVASLVELYGDGSDGPKGQGIRSRGFDLDSKVQVFETTIRGIGGLLSAHLFAIGHLPIKNYEPPSDGDILWPNGFVYDGQLLRLAVDLSERLLPAFHTSTGLPYPRVNLRHGIPFYNNSNIEESEQTRTAEEEASAPREITETCSAGAGSLVLEFAVLSRLTGDRRFEDYAKKAFQSVWDRRTPIGLIGAGIDAETGNWMAPFTGIGAGIDSFFEYAVKSHILLDPDQDWGFGMQQNASQTPDYYGIWEEAHSSIKHHLYRDRSFQHPHFIQGDIYTGAARAFWMDSLSAYYPGLLTLTGDLDEAISTHMLYVALWDRYSAIPERWNAATGTIDSGLRWWPGRPEFIESNWYIYRATQDPWFLHVAEMVLKDINKRCRTECGWAGLEDVRTGELKDRMESFFLGETAKYLFLTFDPEHPLNNWGDSWVFTTEGHPVVLQRNTSRAKLRPKIPSDSFKQTSTAAAATCPRPPALSPLSISPTVLRDDYFHAASLARLHFVNHTQYANNTAESSYDDFNIASRTDQSPTDYLFYPWTLPVEYTPNLGTCPKMQLRMTFDLAFPTLANTVSGPLSLRRVNGGITIGSVSGLKLGMTRETVGLPTEEAEGDTAAGTTNVFRIHSVGHFMLGRDEKVFMAPEVVADLNPVDPYFTRHRDLAAADIVVDTDYIPLESFETTQPDAALSAQILLENGPVAQGWLQHLSNMLQEKVPLENFFLNGAAHFGTSAIPQDQPAMPVCEAYLATGPGAAPLPDIADVASLAPSGTLPWPDVYVADELCDDVLAPEIPRNHQVIVVRRGGCTFWEKMKNIPSFPPSHKSLKIVMIVNFPIGDDPSTEVLIRPLLEKKQETPGGVQRPYQIPVVMVEGGQTTYEMLKAANGVGLRRHYHYSTQGVRISNLHVM